MSNPQNTKMQGVPLKAKLLLAAHSFAADRARRPDMTINRRLMNLFDPKAPPSPSKPHHGVLSTDTSIDSSRNLWFRLFNPFATTIASSLPVIIYYHGGGFAFMGPDSRNYDDFCRRLATQIPAIIISVNYRLSPEHKYPSHYDDGFDAVKFIDDGKLSDLPTNADLNRCFLAGDSAGGNLAHHVAVRCGEQENQLQKVKIVGLIAVQPFFGGEERTPAELRILNTPVLSLDRTDWLWKAFLPEGSDRNHEAANVFGPNGKDISGIKFPSTVLFVGGFDLLQDWQRKYYEGLKESGKEVKLVEYPDAFHGFFMLTNSSNFRSFVSEVSSFVQSKSAEIETSSPTET
ncbi:Alpha/beta hydrolase fold-3 [Dillenia turbinata]|uniref:Alpha/beta hydrolase fold-3 n=1 Tax=Dillenia turbinata TaxID=194707 RepID=A0AAN8ZKX0_9MAGN